MIAVELYYYIKGVCKIVAESSKCIDFQIWKPTFKKVLLTTADGIDTCTFTAYQSYHFHFSFHHMQQIHHPFAVQPATTSSFQQPALVYHNNAWKTTNQLAIEASVSQAAKPLVEKFPVSTGLDHTREDNDVTVSENVFAKYQVYTELALDTVGCW